ncbi:bifunctional aspartate kinase/homoserine dehydrogenase I [Ancylomarina euxinus]|uniref:Bifunctional aspartate kinase/homoserine dehydrogenase I n=1 Tax=Ancylomarina euxinus TaxID=2283627 RepID=A0A425Y1E2_9BACT|nr:bifunctional aspartate kinase/homoserine dehydrogenase I [Ancylomarina euxinus]MCZ4695187.1 bifunctional aspartate kinase/homoserine dehydrogenase I [Ancylomarina euxinus]MUP14879.1 bifunctional aspartate kinase/homoserine dehydrogenase I [Ancylomarina euxinus]RRG21774.1 bifunctional aspartate kinase/homoserine dehydrogenase I [Ancylomarina euxinus]
MRILKFGGSSVAQAESLKKVQQIVSDICRNEPAIIVVSALGGVTDLLANCLNQACLQDQTYKRSLEKLYNRHLNLSQELKLDTITQSWLKEKFKDLSNLLEGVFILQDVPEKVKCRVLGLGEELSSELITHYFQKSDLNARHYDSREYIKTIDNKGILLNREDSYRRINAIKDEINLAIFPGFIASNEKGEPTLLGRGGSDYTASILAAALDAKQLEIWTDVSGMYTADPRLVTQAIPIDQMSFQEAMELSHFGAKVMYPPALTPVLQKKIDILIKNTFEPEAQGTLISSEPKAERTTVRGLSSINHINLITLSGSGMVGISGFAARLFACLANQKINVSLITQSSSEHSMSVAVHEDDCPKACNIIEDEFAVEIAMNHVDKPKLELDLSIIAVVGEDMGYTPGISGKVFGILGKNGLNIRAMAQGGNELNITFMVRTTDVKKALNVIHEKFFLSTSKKVNLYIAGVGNVGSKLLEHIKSQHKHLIEEKGIDLIIRAVSNSRKMFFTEDEKLIEDWQKKLNEEGQTADIKKFIKNIEDSNLRNSIFVDITASQEVSEVYDQILDSTTSIVACNKIAASSEYANYKRLKQVSKKNNVDFRFESNVGAGLPVISTINYLKNTGDQITSIEAVVSGSLNYIINKFIEGYGFDEALKLAISEGFTEPDPKLDLNGVDVLRKLLILARESGYTLEANDVDLEAMVPEYCLKSKTTGELIERLVKKKEFFENWRKQMNEQNVRFRYIASFKDGKASVGMKTVGPEHPFYNIDGKDSIVSLNTLWYKDQPMIIKGAGAGAEVTASGIFGDIISISSK